jgi:hypothetical protein
MGRRAQSIVGQVVGQVSDLPFLKFLSDTRPRPFLGSLNQARTHRVSFDVAYDVLEFLVSSHPMIIGFILPKRLAAGANSHYVRSETWPTPRRSETCPTL